MTNNGAVANQPARRQVRPVVLALSGVALIAAMATLLVLYANFPSGYQNTYGFTRSAYALFGEFIHYPILELSASQFQSAALALILASWVAYVGAVSLCGGIHAGHRKMMAVVIAVAILLAVGATLAMPPALSSDVFLYAGHGRSMAFAHANPYIGTASTQVDAAYAQLTPWAEMQAEYGPVWLLVSSLLVRIAPDNVLGTVLAFKGFALLCHAANGVLVYLIAERARKGAGLKALLIYAWNPLIITEVLASAHNDVLMVTLALLGVYLATKDRREVGWVLLMTSVLVKYLTGILLLLVAARWLRETEPHQRVGLLLRLGALGLAVAALLYAPFVLNGATVRDLLPGSHALANPNHNVIFAVLQEVGGRVGSAVGVSDEVAQRALQALLYTAFITGVGLALRKTLSSSDATWTLVLSRAAWLMIVYVVFVFGAMFPWYLVTPLTLATLSSCADTCRNRVLLYSNALAALYLLPYGWLTQV